MQIYLVGGAVRDGLLGLPVTERDWVVVGATAEQMVARGFQPVGKAFPVFLHPETHEEYALARTERKIGKGYQGFTFYASPTVTLEEDLARRDLTINAMAQSESGQITDPYGGQKDLNDRIFRHVSPAFAEDPVRILRIARFSSRFPEFSVHPETLKLMRQLVAAGEVEALVPERVWQELYRALENARPDRFFECLQACHAQAILFPMLETSCSSVNFSVNIHDKNFNVAQRFAILTHALAWEALQLFFARYPVPTALQELAELVHRYAPQLKTVVKTFTKSDPAALLAYLLDLDALRREPRFKDFLAVARWCYPEITAQDIDCLLKALHAIRHVDNRIVQAQHLTGKAFAEALYKLRIAALFDML